MLRVSRRAMSQAYASRETWRRHSERRQKMMYDEQGRLRWWGAVQYYWGEINITLRIVSVTLFTLVVYTKFVVGIEVGNTQKNRSQQDERIDHLRATGKLKSEKFLTIQNRQIDDPDFGNFPTHGGKGVWRSKVLDDDAHSSGELQDERRFAK